MRFEDCCSSQTMPYQLKAAAIPRSPCVMEQEILTGKQKYVPTGTETTTGTKNMKGPGPVLVQDQDWVRDRDHDQDQDQNP